MYASPPKLNLVSICSADLERAENFYSILGLFFQKHSNEKGTEYLACGPYKNGYTFEIHPTDCKLASTKGVRIGFNIDCVDPYLGDLVSAGGEITEEPHDDERGRRAVIADPDGHKIELLSPPNRM